MDEETRGDMVAQAAPGSKETGKLSDYFDMEPGDFGYDQQLGGRPNRPYGKAKKVVFTEDGPVFADEQQAKKSEEDAALKAILKKKPEQILKEDKTEIVQKGNVHTEPVEIPEPELNLFNSKNNNTETVVEEPATTEIENIQTIPSENDEVTDIVDEDESTDEVDEPEVLSPDTFENEIDEPEPVKEIMTGETEVDGIEEDEESVDNMLGGIDIDDLPEDIPEELLEPDGEAEPTVPVRTSKKKTSARKKSDKTVKTKKKATTASKTTTKKTSKKK